MFNTIKNIFPKYLKNIFIFIPLLIANIEINSGILIDYFFGFIFFCIMTTVVYITNDFIDYDIDKFNKIKKKYLGKRLNKNIIIFLNLLLIPLFFITELVNIFSIFLIIYLVSFYFYTFKGKHIKYLDLIFLNSFFILRILYGCDLSNIEISPWFIAFFSSLFFILSVFKRFIQIKINELKNKNKIIAYNYKDLSIFRTFINGGLLFNLIVFISYIFQDSLYFYFFNLESSTTYFNKMNYLLIFFIYLFNFLLLLKKLNNNVINEDIFSYVVKDKIVIFSSLITLIILIIPIF